MHISQAIAKRIRYLTPMLRDSKSRCIQQLQWLQLQGSIDLLLVPLKSSFASV